MRSPAKLSLRTDIGRQLSGYCLTTAEIIYRPPDHLDLMQTLIWRVLDLPPKFPELHKFLGFGEREIEALPSQVKVANFEILRPSRARHVEHAHALY